MPVKYSPKDIGTFFHADRMDERARLLFEADTDAVLEKLCVGDVLDARAYKTVIRSLADLGYCQRRPVDISAPARHQSGVMTGGDTEKQIDGGDMAMTDTPPEKYLDARQVAEKYGFKLGSVRKWLAHRKTTDNPTGLQAYKIGGRVYTTAKDFDDFVKAHHV